MDARTYLDHAAHALLADFVKQPFREPVICGVVATHAWELSITAIRRSEIASMATLPRCRERPPEAPDLEEPELNIYLAIDATPTSEEEISRRTGYRRGQNMRRILSRLVNKYDIVAKRARGRYQRVAASGFEDEQ
jgi:hypothetical protein